MIKQKEETRKGLLLCPDQLNAGYHLVELITIRKTPGGVPDFSNTPCTNKELKSFFPDIPPMVVLAIGEFDQATLNLQIAEIKEAVEQTNAGNGEFARANILRSIHSKLEKLKPLSVAVKWYHRFLEDGRYKIFPCSFNSYRPQLSFVVKKKGQQFYLDTFIELNNARFSLEDFVQYQFLLRSRNEYFLLSFKDFKTLEWLKSIDFLAQNLDSASFESDILARLEGDYTVDRNNLLTETEIVTQPANRIYLSELSGSFLMLTPQWKYDDFLIDGSWQPVYKTTLRGKTYSVVRDKEAEQAFVDFIQTLHPHFSQQKSKGYFYLSFAEAQKKQWFLKVYHKLLEADIELTGLDMLKHFKFSAHKATTEVEILEKNDTRVQIRLRLSFGKEIVLLTELQKTLMAGQHAVLLNDGSLGVLGEDWLQQYSTIIKHGKILKDIISVPSWMAVNEPGNDKGLALQKTIPDDWWARWKRWQQPSARIFELPANLNATLRPYQHKGYEWLGMLSELGAGACLADDMGLGKTLQTIAFIGKKLEEHPEQKNLIVCPASLIYNWQSEFERFAPSIKTVVHHGASRKNEVFFSDTQVIITTYGTLRSDSEKVRQTSFSIIVLDESHHIKNPSSQIAQLVLELEAKWRIALSGTPVMNNTFDLYSQLNFIIPGMFGTKEFFKKEYADPIDIHGDEEKLKSLTRLTAPFILRRSKEQVAPDLPAKTEMIKWCQLGTAQKQQYEEIREQVKSKLMDNIRKEGMAKSKLFVLQAITKLRQVCDSPLLLPENERTCTDSIKTAVLMDELEYNLGGHKALVFSQFSSMLDLLAAECEQRGLAYYHFDGQTSAAKRAAMVEAFQSPGDRTPVFLISLKAGNAGLNLTAADYVFLFDPWWNTAVQQQAIDRTHRIGQQKSVFAYQMICKDTIEEKIIAIQHRKQKLSKELLATDDGFLETLSEEEVLYLFS